MDDVVGKGVVTQFSFWHRPVFSTHILYFTWVAWPGIFSKTFYHFKPLLLLLYVNPQQRGNLFFMWEVSPDNKQSKVDTC